MDYYKASRTFGGVFSRDNLPILKNKFYLFNLEDQQGEGTHWVAIYNIGNECIYFDSFGVDPPEEALDKMRQTKKNMIMNTYRIQDLNSVNCGKYCIYIIDGLLNGRKYIDILSDFDPKEYKKNDTLINSYV